MCLWVAPPAYQHASLTRRRCNALHLPVSAHHRCASRVPADAATRARAHSHPCVCLTLAAGVGTGITVSIRTRNGHLPDTLAVPGTVDYLPPQIDFIVPNEGLRPAGNSPLTLLGNSFGVNGVATVTVDGTECVLTARSDVGITCNAPPAYGMDLPVLLTVAGQSSYMASVSYGTAVMASISPDVVLPGNGSLKYDFTVTGSDLPLPALASRYNITMMVGTVACPTVQLVSQTIIRCRNFVAPRSWATPLVVLNIRSLADGTLLSALSRDLLRPQVAPVVTVVSTTSMPTAGNVTIRLLGDGFGVVSTDVTAIFMNGVRCATWTWSSQAEVRFLLPAGVGANLPIQVQSRGGLLSAAVNVSYDAPTVTAVTPAWALAGAVINGTIICGTNFGAHDADITFAFVGGLHCAATVAINDTCLRCDGLNAAAGWVSGRETSAQVAIGRQASGIRTGVFTGVPLPRVTALQPAVVMPGDTVVVFGIGFGVDATAITNVTIGALPCSSWSWVSGTVLSCVTPAALAGDGFVTVHTAAGVSSPANDTTARITLAATASFPPPAWSPTEIAGSREAGKFEAVFLTWRYPAPSVELTGTGAIEAAVSFVLESSGNPDFLPAVTSSQTVLRSESLQRSAILLEEHLLKITVSVHTPLYFRLRARNSGGDGPLSNASAPVVETCLTTQFLTTHLPVSAWVCSTCPLGASCSGSGAGSVAVTAGHWRVPWSADGLAFAECLVPAACPPAAAPAVNGSTAAFNTTDNSTVIESCASGYTGVLCASCSQGYAKSALGTCSACGDQATVSVRMLALLAFILLVVATLLVRAFNNATGEKSVFTQIVKLIFNHFQTVAMVGAVAIQWPAALSGFFTVSDASSSVSTDGLSLACVLPPAASTAVARAAITISVPAWLITYAALFWACWVCMPRCGGRTAPLAAAPATPCDEPAKPAMTTATHASSPGAQWWIRIKVSAVVLLFLAHTSVTRATLRLLTCLPITPLGGTAETQLRLLEDLSLRCDSMDDFKAPLVLGVTSLLVYCAGFPAAIYVLGRLQRITPRKPGADGLAPTAVSDTISPFNFVFSGYNDEYLWWEAVILLRKVALAAVTVVLAPAGPPTQFKAASSVLFVAFAAHAWAQPYRSVDMNRLEFTSLFVIGISFSLGSFLQPAVDGPLAALLSSIIIIANIAFVLVWLYTLVAATRSQMASASGRLQDKPVVGALMRKLSSRSHQPARSPSASVLYSVENPMAVPRHTPFRVLVAQPTDDASTSLALPAKAAMSWQPVPLDATATASTVRATAVAAGATSGIHEEQRSSFGNATTSRRHLIGAS